MRAFADNAGRRWDLALSVDAVKRVTLDAFMAEYCEPTSRDQRRARRSALLAAGRHGTVTLPTPAEPYKRGQPKRFSARELLARWQGVLDEGVYLPKLKAEFANGRPSPGVGGNKPEAT